MRIEDDDDSHSCPGRQKAIQRHREGKPPARAAQGWDWGLCGAIARAPVICSHCGNISAEAGDDGKAELQGGEQASAVGGCSQEHRGSPEVAGPLTPVPEVEPLAGLESGWSSGDRGEGAGESASHRDGQGHAPPCAPPGQGWGGLGQPPSHPHQPCQRPRRLLWSQGSHQALIPVTLMFVRSNISTQQLNHPAGAGFHGNRGRRTPGASLAP